MRYLSIFIAIALPAWSIGLLVGALLGTIEIRNQATKKGCAIYHPQTGEFTWKCDLEKTDGTAND